MRRFGNVLAGFSTRWIPDAFVFAVFLSLLAYIMALGFTDRGPYELLEDWYSGFWGLLEFGMQMTLVLVTGYALASSGPAERGIAWLASLPRGPKTACLLTAFGAALMGVMHWGLGLIAGALLALRVAQSCKERGIKVHFPLLAAAGYMGLMVWHSGLSGSIPLLVNTEGHFLEDQIGTIPLSETIFQPFNLVFLLVMLIGAPLILMGMHPKAEESEEVRDSTGGDSSGGGSGTALVRLSRAERNALPPAQRLMHSRVPTLIIVVAGAIYLVPSLLTNGIVSMDINLLNFAFLIVGLGLHGTLASYASSAAEGAKTASSVVVQFPLYAGIMGMMDHSGLLEIVTQAFISISTPLTYPFWALMSAALVNIAVPSGGGQWAIQGPVVVGGTEALGIEPGVGVMAVGIGEQLTNGIQPFWALPLLALTKLRAGQVLGYSSVVMFFGLMVASVCITFLR